jgi:hypothetical protein
MNVALCYIGYLRTWEQCRPNHFDTIWKPNISDWNEGDERGSEIEAFFYTYEDPRQAGGMLGRSTWTQCPHPFYDDPFGPHKFNSHKAGESQACHTLNMMHNNLVGFSLIPKGYDFYVRIRPDMKFNGTLNFADYEPKENTVYIPKGMDYRGINDQFAFGDYDSMRKYFSVYLNCEELFAEGHLFNSEVYHLANLNKLGVNIVRFDHPQHDLVR